MSALQAVGGIVGRQELRERWGVTRQRVLQITSEPDFPAPIATVNGQPAWRGDEAEAWRASHPIRQRRSSSDER